MEQVNVNVCGHKIQSINDSSVLVHKHLCNFLSEIQGLCVCVCVCVCVRVGLCKGACV